VRGQGNSGFKARPFNKIIFQKEASLPQVEKKKATDFSGFKLSNSNAKLGRKALEDYLEE